MLTPFVSTSGSVVFNAFVSDATGYSDATYSAAQYTTMNAQNFMKNESTMWTSLGADGKGTGKTTGVLINVRPGIAVKYRRRHHHRTRYDQPERH